MKRIENHIIVLDKVRIIIHNDTGKRLHLLYQSTKNEKKGQTLHEFYIKETKPWWRFWR